MAATTKPILYNGYSIGGGLTVKHRVERIFFAEVYSLSDGRYLCIFTNIKPDDAINRRKKHNLTILDVAAKKYLGVITEEYSREKIAAMISDLTVLRGFDCVAGMKDLKALLINEVIDPILNPEKFKKFRLSIPNGILLYGPPGCGKTFIVKKLAEELDYNFFEMGPSSVATPYVHGAVSNIARVFEMAKIHAPSIVFIDEIEGLIPKREELSAWADIKKEEINEFLLQLNNAGDNKILVVGATNRPQMIDSALLRSGRMDKRIFVAPPDFEARKEMMRICLAGRPYDKDIDFEKLANMTENYVGSDIELIVTEAARIAVANEKDLIDEKTIIEALHKFSPSISKEEIKNYDQFSHMERW